MPEVTEVLPEFPGFAVRYDPAAHTFFNSMMVESLRKLQEVALGRTLLASINDSAPRSRGKFPASVKVMCVPTDINFTQSGYKREVTYGEGGSTTITGMTKTKDPKFNPKKDKTKKCPFWIAGTSYNEALDQDAADNGNGTVCTMHFSNAQVLTNNNEKADPHIVLAHELIHSMHCLYGNRKDEEEERWTIGLGIWASEAMTENAFREQFQLLPRTQF
jgi:hypothetical protein